MNYYVSLKKATIYIIQITSLKQLIIEKILFKIDHHII